MYSLLAAMLGATFLCCSISYHISTTYFETITPLTHWFLNRAGFNLPFIIITFLTGMIFFMWGYKGSPISKMLHKFGGLVMNFYASAGGSALGWVLGICIAACLDDFNKYFPSCFYVSLMAFAILLMPLICFHYTYETFNHHNNKFFANKSVERPVRLMGILIMGIAIFELVYFFST